MLIRKARRADRIVITATQMMESMVQNPIPTRAEVFDVANAVLDGSDAVMLSAETASGRYPVETVTAMAATCLGAETWPEVRRSDPAVPCNSHSDKAQGVGRVTATTSTPRSVAWGPATLTTCPCSTGRCFRPGRLPHFLIRYCGRSLMQGVHSMTSTQP